MNRCRPGETQSDSPLILVLETSGSTCSAALAAGEEIRHKGLSAPMQHASKLAPLVQELFEDVRRPAASLDGIAVSMGPGSYTGLRIGLALAKGLCQVTGARLMGISTFDILLATLRQVFPETMGKPSLICLQSKKDYLYIAGYNAEGSFFLRPENYPVQQWHTLMPSDLKVPVIAGNGASLFCEASGISDAQIYSELEAQALYAAPLALEAWREGRFAPVHETEPLYLSGFYPRPQAMQGT